MGREENIKVLHPYIDEALRINAVDRYFMIDMTRNMSDHKFIQQEQERLNKKYPNRIFIVNKEERAKQIADNTVLETVGYWAPFYKFLDTFEDHDVIMKMDDDTLFIDVESLSAAAEFRWRNKDALIMHSNCINNGITAYHQAQKGVWRFEDPEINMYPPQGLTGPLFAHPDVACKCHKQFVNDLIKDPANLDSYRLNKNIYFANRVSINCMILLGSDRKYFSSINSQDEYLTSSKIGQELDRPNMVIGDFITSHHTYGVQEPCMEEHGTFEYYKELRDRWFEKEVDRKNKPINHEVGESTSIKVDGNYFTRSWMDADSYAIKNRRTGAYLVMDYQVVNRDVKEGEEVSSFLRTTITESTDRSVAFNIGDNITIATELLKSRNPNPKVPQFNTFFLSRFYQKNYTKQGVVLHKNSDGSYRIESKREKGFFLFSKTIKKNDKDETMFLFKKEDDNFTADDWDLIPYSSYENQLLISRVVRENIHDYENDPTYAEAVYNDTFPQYRGPRGFYWNTRGQLWEFIKLQNGSFNIKCIDDERKSVWLGCTSEKPLTTEEKHRSNWKLIKKNNKYEIREVVSNMAIHLTEGGDLIMHSQATLFDIDINED